MRWATWRGPEPGSGGQQPGADDVRRRVVGPAIPTTATSGMFEYEGALSPTFLTVDTAARRSRLTERQRGCGPLLGGGRTRFVGPGSAGDGAVDRLVGRSRGRPVRSLRALVPGEVAEAEERQRPKNHHWSP